MTVLPADDHAQVRLPHWLPGADRAEAARLIRAALDARRLHPVAAVRLADVLTELHVAAARDAVWPEPAARVRRATGWSDDVLPVRLSAAELASLLAVPGFPSHLRRALTAGRT